MSTDFDGFQTIELHPRADNHSGCVYVLIFSKDGIDKPFYVGQTKRFLGRMDDYFWADFQAATDFKVGEAIRYFCTPPINGKVFAKYKASAQPRDEETLLIAELKGRGLTLLNSVEGYDYRTADKQNRTAALHSVCEAIIDDRGR